MSSNVILKAQSRKDLGKGASRRLRRLESMVPAIVYGGSEAPVNVQVAVKDLVKNLESEAFYTQVFALEIDGKNTAVFLKDLQRHPAKGTPMHADFLRIDTSKAIRVKVPLHFMNEAACKGVKAQGGSIHHLASEVEIECLPLSIPKYIEVDMTDVEAGTALHYSNLVLPKNVSIPALELGKDHDTAIAMIKVEKGAAEGSDS